MKVVKGKIDGKIVYRSEPEFEEGFGIKNAIALHGGIPKDYEEIEITEEEWEESIKPTPEQIEETKIQVEMQRILREQAVANLKARGEMNDVIRS